MMDNEKYSSYDESTVTQVQECFLYIGGVKLSRSTTIKRMKEIDSNIKKENGKYVLSDNKLWQFFNYNYPEVIKNSKIKNMQELKNNAQLYVLNLNINS